MGHAFMAYHKRVALLSLDPGEHTAETPILRLSSVHWWRLSSQTGLARSAMSALHGILHEWFMSGL
mgnify:FL=1